MIDLFGSARLGVVITLAGASLASPFIMKSHAVQQLTGRGGKPAPAVVHVVAGGFQYDVPAGWGQLGADSAEANAGEQASGIVVAGVCPGGSTGASCAGGVQVTFVAYDGKHGKLPLPTSFAASLDSAMPKRMPGFHRLASETGPTSDGTTWLRYEFATGAPPAQRRELLGAFRHGDGSGAVAVATGTPAALARHRTAIVRVLASAQEVLDTDDAPDASS